MVNVLTMVEYLELKNTGKKVMKACNTNPNALSFIQKCGAFK